MQAKRATVSSRKRAQSETETARLWRWVALSILAPLAEVRRAVEALPVATNEAEARVAQALNAIADAEGRAREVARVARWFAE